ncbi:MAG: amidohydrolase [Chloroflexi bacterium]|nr:amidohydrolase [Chloroflexota bacterium]MCI0769797.1 amidohydrolase [Chloroflexota bacterium]
MKYKVVSTDDHLQEAPHTWTSRMSAKKWGDKIPQIKPISKTQDAWYIYGEPRTMLGIATVHGVMEDRARNLMKWEEVPEIAYVPSERIKAMDQDGVDVHTFFGNVAGIAGNTFSNPDFDEDYRLEAIQAFNDFQIEEYADPYPGRFITLATVPLWDVDKAVAEVNRMYKRGVKGVSFAFPQQFGYPNITSTYWDPFWAVCQDLNLSLNLHIGSGGSQGFMVAPQEGYSEMLRLAEMSTKAISANTQVMSTILFCGILQRFPTLKVVSSESGLGWVPYLLEVADHQWERQKLIREGMAIKPSDYFHRQCYVNFWFEQVGIEMRHHIGIDNIMWESDFPHPTCTWPNSQDYIERSLKGVPADERQKILVDNGVRVFNLDGG